MNKGKAKTRIRLAVAGATGRTGRCVVEVAGSDDRFEIAAALTKPGCSMAGKPMRFGNREFTVADRLDVACDVLVDFSVAGGTMTWLEVCKRRDIPMVIGATGHDEPQLAKIKEAAGVIPLLKATNFSLGVQAMLDIIGRLANELGESYDVEIVEAHHRHKVDAPSGTALTLLDEIASSLGRPLRDNVVFGREGLTGERPPGQIGVHAVRMGDIISWHEVHFSGPGETVTIRHTAHSRVTFAVGALRAAAWIAGKPPGFYTMQDLMERA